MRNWERATAAKKIKSLREKLNRMTMSRKYYLRRTDILEAIIRDIDPTLLPPRGSVGQESFFETYQRNLHTNIISQPVNGPETLSESVLRESALNSVRHPQGRRWSFVTLVLCYVVRTLGSKAYDYLRHFVILPCKQTLLNHFHSTAAAWAECLVEVSNVERICDLFRRRNGVSSSEKVAVGIGVDAISMEPVLINGEVHNHVFLFELLPLSSYLKPLPLHIMPRVNGNAGPEIFKTLAILKASLRKMNFVVKFVATDGDRGYDNQHLIMFSKWQKLYYDKGLDKVIESVPDEDDDVIITDLLHLLKNARSKLLNGKVSVFCDGSFAFCAAEAEENLNLGAALRDFTSKGRMRDIYVLEIFTLENVVKLITRGETAMAFYILPYAMWVSAVMNPGISCEMRRSFLSFVVTVFGEILANINFIDTQKVSINKKDSTRVQFAFSENHLRRALNTLLVQLSEIEKMPDGLALDRLGTHVLECCFGMIRLQCRHKHNWKMISKAFTRLILLDDLSLILGHPITIDKRVNIAGTTVVNNSDAITMMLPDIPASRLWQAAKATMSRKERTHPAQVEESNPLDTVAPEFVHLGEFFQGFIEICADSHVQTLPRMWHGSSVSNSTILARLIEFCHKPFTGPDDPATEGETSQICLTSDPSQLSEMLRAVELPSTTLP